MELLNAIGQLFTALYHVGVTLLALVLPWTPLILWVAVWAFAVNWVSLRRVLLRGGWISALLIMLITIIGWGVIAPPESGSHLVLGLTLSNFVGKTVYVTALAVIALLCGSVQLAGLCGSWARFEERPAEEPHPAHSAH